ncbi:MAG: hypothetical protein ACKVQC_09285 [Elusimicrobiota bacterium]
MTSFLFSGTCPMCRDTLASGGSTGLISGFYWSIILIVSVPLVFFAVGYKLIRKYW